MSANPRLKRHIVEAIRGVVGDGEIALHAPSFEGNESSYLQQCLDSTFVSSVGAFVGDFEKSVAEFTGAKYAIAVVNGTAALHLALKLAGVEAREEVLVPALTFVATANAVSYCNATPHFVDSDESTLGINTSKLREYLKENTVQNFGCCMNKVTGNVIRALVPMHTFGNPVDLDGVLSISHDFNIALVEDAAESLGSYYEGRHTGTFGSLGVLSFNGNKIITTGGGGVILTNDPNLARRAKHLSTTAKAPHKWDFLHDEIGYNYRLPNLNAALGLAQMEQLPEKILAKRRLFTCYKDAFSKVDGIKIFTESSNCRSNYWLQTLLLDTENENQRDDILQHTNDVGIMTRPAWQLLNKMKQYKNCPKMDLTEAENLSRRIINIPSSSFLGPASR